MKINKALVIFVLTFLLPFYLPAQQADDIIDKHVSFIGGKKSWEEVKTLKATGEYNYGGIKFPFTTYAKAPNLYKFIVPFEGKYYAQAFDGKRGWKIDAFKNETSPTLLTGKEASSMANEQEVALENIFIDYKRKGHRATLEAKDTLEGKSCLRVKFVRSGGEVETLYFDELTAALLMKTSVSKNSELQGSTLNTWYSDYRKVGNIRIPFKAVSKSGDQVILEVTVENAVLNVPIADDEFQPPN
jgi:hypothetical protein